MKNKRNFMYIFTLVLEIFLIFYLTFLLFTKNYLGLFSVAIIQTVYVIIDISKNEYY